MKKEQKKEELIEEPEVLQGGNQDRAWGDDDLVGTEFLPWAKVGEVVSIRVCKVVESKRTKIVSNKSGEVIDLALSGVDYTVYIEDDSKTESEKIRKLNIATWEVVGKLRKILRDRKEAKKPLWGWRLTIEHINEGKGKGKKTENYNLIEEDS